VLGKIFGCKTEKKIGGSGKLYNESVHYLNSLLDILVIKSRRVRWTRHVVRAREKRKSYRISVGKPEGKIALERGRGRWKDGIKTVLKEIEWKKVDWIYLIQDTEKWRAAAKTLLNFSVL
jgi:hypothetical protein